MKPVIENCSEVAGHMAQGFRSPDQCDFKMLDRGGLCATRPFGTLATDTSDRASAAIEGSPRWQDPDFSSLAQRDGDATALLSAYQRYGKSVAQHISGAFAFAIFDFVTDEAILAIDRLGIRPMCYALGSSGEIVFGSTTQSVLAYPNVVSTLSPQSIYRYMYFHVVPSPSTIYENIKKLQPAQLVVVKNSSIRTEQYWNPDSVDEKYAELSELTAELRTLTQQAVNRCNPDDSAGCFLSGGLDSSTVSGIASQNSRSPIRAYSIGFDQEGYDEIRFARIAAEHFGLEHREYYVTPNDVADAFDLISTSYDEPFGNSSAIPSYFCAKCAKEDGVSMLLAGDGGDELFAGNERYATQQIFQFYERVPTWMRHAILEPLIQHLPMNWSTLTRKTSRYLEQARIAMPERLQTYNFLHINNPKTVFDTQFLRKIDIDSPIREMSDWYAQSENLHFVDRMLRFDWKLTLADNDLRKVNRMCEIQGVGVAYPLLDDDLVEFSTRIPASIKLKRNQLRYFFKHTYKDMLPAAIITKEKHGFGLPFGDWLKSSAQLQNKVLPCIDRLKDRKIFRDEFIEDMLHKHQTEHAAFYGNIIWVMAVLDNWLEAHSEISAPRKVAGLAEV